MPVRLSPAQAAQMRKLVDPLIAARLDAVAAKPARSTAHKAPKVARRVSVGGGPEGTGRVLRGPDGSTLSLELELGLLPVPKERPRVVRTKSGKTVSYTPARTKRFTDDVRAVVDAVMAGAPPIGEPVAITMVFRMDVPESWPLWRKEAARQGRIAPTSRPDMDNLEKALLDAFNGKAFVDDSLVVDRTARKRFADVPGITVCIEALPVCTQTAPRSDVARIPTVSSEPSFFFRSPHDR